MSLHHFKPRKSILIHASWLLLVSLLLPAGAQPTITVTVNPKQPGHVISTDFAGLSFEMQYVLTNASGGHFFNLTNRPLIAMFKQLGVKNLRVGGNTADRASLPVPDEADADSLFAFARAAGVKVIYTLRLNHGNADDDAKMVNYILRHYKNQLDCFAIGNEPNVFSTNYAGYFAKWKRFETKIIAASPDAKFSGPGVSPGHQSWSGEFADDLGKSGLLKIVTQHDYPGGDARKVKDPATARDKILSPAMDEHYLKFSDTFVPSVLSNGLPYRLEEANSLYDGGALDVSDTFASALWALDYQWWWAEHGASGVNFHTGDKVAAHEINKPCRYAIFWSAPDGYNVHPIGYALKMFSLAAHGRLLSTTVENTNHLNLRVYAAAPRKNEVGVTLINREHGSSARTSEVILNLGLNHARAEFMLLTVSDGNVAAKTGVTLGGAEILDNATWNGKWTPLPRSSDSGKFILELPPATAALVRATGK